MSKQPRRNLESRQETGKYGKYLPRCIHCDWINKNSHRDKCVETTSIYKAYINSNRFSYAFSVVLTAHDISSNINEIEALLYSINHFRQNFLTRMGFSSNYFLINRTIRYDYTNNREHAHAWIVLIDDRQKYDGMYGTVNGCYKTADKCIKISDKDEHSVYSDTEYIVGRDIVPSLENIFANKNYYIIENGSCLLLRYAHDASIDNKLKKFNAYNYLDPNNTGAIRSKCGASNELRLANEAAHAQAAHAQAAHAQAAHAQAEANSSFAKRKKVGKRK